MLGRAGVEQLRRMKVWVHSTLREVWRDENGGEKDNLNTVLILAAIVLPLLLVLIMFRDDLIRILDKLFNDEFGN